MIQLVIQLDDNGVLSMAGPVDDIYSCYALLELAKDAVRDIAAGKNIPPKPTIEIVPAGALSNKH